MEEGILEYKRALLRPVFLSLEGMQFASVSFAELELHDLPLANLLFVILLQRLVCSGVIAPARGKPVQAISTEHIPGWTPSWRTSSSASAWTPSS